MASQNLINKAQQCVKLDELSKEVRKANQKLLEVIDAELLPIYKKCKLLGMESQYKDFIERLHTEVNESCNDLSNEAYEIINDIFNNK